MRHTSTFIHSKSIAFVILACLFVGSSLFAQSPTTIIKDYVIWGNSSAQVGSSSIQGGAIGSNTLVKSVGNMIAGTSANKTNIYSGGTIVLANSNVVNGNITSGLYPFATQPPSGTIFSAGTSENFTGNIDVYGNILIGGGTVTGTVTNPISSTYKLGAVTKFGTGTPKVAILPQQLPVITDLSLIYSTPVVIQKITSGTVVPGNYGDLSIGGNSTVTLSGPGTYVFKSITTTGPNSSIIFNFNSLPGNYLIYVYGDVILNRTSCSITNGGTGAANRIFTEVHGTGATNGGVTFSMSNGSNGNGNASSWFGSVWAPFATITIGTPNGPAMAVQGAFWSGTQVNVVDGVNIVYNPSAVNTCTAPSITAQPSASTQTKCLNSSSTPLSVTATGTGLSYQWYSNSTNSISGGTSLGSGSGAQTPTYTPSTTTAGTLYYYVVVSGACTPSVTSNVSGAVTVNPTSVAGTVSSNQAICSGSSPADITLSGQTGTIQWQSSSDNITFTNIAGATATTLTSVQMGNLTTIRYYRAVVTSGVCASATSGVVTVTVNALPAITTQPTAPTATCDGSGTQTISVTATGPGLTYSWRKAGIAVINGGVISGQGTSTLTLTSAIATDAGSYDVVVSGTCAPTVTSTAVTVTVNTLPSIVDAAGPDKPYNFDGSTTIGRSDLTGFTFKWTAPPGGLITTADNLATINVSAPGIYKLAFTSAAGCTSTDNVEVSNKVNTLIGSELTSVYWNNPTGQPSPFFIIANGYIRIDVIVQVNNYDYVLGLLQQTILGGFPVDYGLKNIVTNGVNGDIQGGSKLIITGDYPIANLLNLNALYAYINFCRPYYQPFSNSGLVNSAGDTTMRSNLVRSGYKINGAGIKVGVISNSFATITSGTTATLPLQPITDPPSLTPQTFITNTAAVDISNGDLSAVHVLQDYPIKSTDEGRAMLQIVHDVAPGAELYFRTGFLTAGDFAAGIKDLSNNGCNVIVDDLTYLTEPFLQDGVVAKAVNAAKTLGVTYFSSAGNFANKSYEKNFTPVDASSIGFIGKTAHDFSGTGDIFQHITLPPGNYTIVLQWVDNIYSTGQMQGTNYDLDMFWTSNTDGTGLKGFNRDNRFGDPLEILPFTISAITDASFLIVNNTPGGNPARIKYIIYRGDVKILEYNEGTSTLVGQANADGAIAVGAARFDKAPPYLATPLIESFSSIGGTKTEGTVRRKPDVVAPDGVNTTVQLGQDYPNNALDGYSNFFGTSAAAPHAAAVAALIMEGKKKFLNQGVSLSTPDQIRSLLQLTAVDMETANNLSATDKFDYISGYGLVNADSAMRTFAAPTATLIEVVVPPAVVPCSGVPFTISITGENFSRNTVVYLINAPGDSIRIIPNFISSSEVSVTISSCVGNPEIKAYTPPKDGTNGTDGGFSNSKYFFSAAITITANDVSKKYGETLAALSTTIKVDGVLLQNTNPLLTLADIGLTNLTVTTAATSQSDVGTYITTFSQIVPADPALLKKYSYKFIDGKVTIAKMPLRVTPNNITVAYGKNIGKVTFDYKFNELNVADPVALKSLIRSYHEAYLPKNTLAVIKDFNKATSNYTLDTTYLRNMNMIASFNAVNNSRKFTLSSSNTLVPVIDASTLQPNIGGVQYLVDVTSESIYNYKVNPATAKFFSVYPGINSKALLSDASISSDVNTIGVVEAPGTLLSTKVINGSLVETINTPDGPIVPIAGGSLIQIIDATINGSSTDLAQYVNGQWVRVTSDVNTHTTILNKVVNALLRGANGIAINVDGNGNSTVQIANGTYSPILTNTLLRGANGSETLVTVVNGSDVPVPDGALIQLDNGDLLLFKLSTYSIEAISNSAILRGLNAMLRGANTLLRGANALLRGANGALLRGANGVEFGTESPVNNTAVILDADDAKANGTGYAWLGSMFGINMITGLDVGKQYLVPGTLVNPNFDISYGLGEVDIAKAEITITPLPNIRDYDGSTTAAAIPTITIGALAGGDLAVLKEAYDNINAGTSKTMIPAVVSIVDALGASTTANYNVTLNPVANGVINKMPLNVTADPQSKSYDGLKFTAFTSTITGFVNNETSAVVSGAAAYTGAATSATAAGTYTITPAIGSLSATNYNFTPFVDGTLVINISTSTITVNGSIVTGSTSFTYTGLPQGPDNSTVTGSTGSVTYSYVGTGATSYAASATKPTNAGTYSVTATVAADGNYYAATSAATAFIISPSNLTITVIGSTSFTYTGLAQGPTTSTFTGSTGAVTYSYVSTLPSSYGPSATKPTNAGNYNATATVAADANYNGATSSAYAFTINKASLTVKAEDKARPYGENNPVLTVSYSGFVNGQDSITSGIKGATDGTGTRVPSASFLTIVTQYSAVGSYTITATSGNLISSNYTFIAASGTLTITPNGCLITHDPANFVNTSKGSTSLWTSLTVKLSGQLAAAGDYVIFRAGDITLNNITSGIGNSASPIPNGKIIAVSGKTSPGTHFDFGSNTWITEVPLGYASTSDIFITGAIFNSSTGFLYTNKSAGASSVVRGMFYSNKSITDKWVYSMAAYQPQFGYGAIGGEGQVAAINGTYRAATPIPEILYIVTGGSGNGGSNYTGSPSNQNPFTACPISSSSAINRVITSSSSVQPAARQDVQDIAAKGDIQVFPNPASAYITLSYIPASTGNSAITLFTIDGKKVMEIDNGVREAGKKYVKRIDVGSLVRGVYVIHLIGTDKIVTKKIIVSR